MRKMILAAMALVAATAVHARNEAVMLPLADVVKLGLEQGKLDGSVSFHLSGASTPAISEKLGDDVSNKKTNGVGKDDATACNWAALSALMAFEAKAKQGRQRRGGPAQLQQEAIHPGPGQFRMPRRQCDGRRHLQGHLCPRRPVI